MPKSKELPPNFDVLETWNELFIVLEQTDKDLKKTVTKGTKRAGVNARKGLKYAKELLSNIIYGSLVEQKKIRAEKPPHGNKNGPGIKAMHEAKKRNKENSS